MTDGNDDPEEGDGESADGAELDPETLGERLDAAAEALEAAETEADLDDVEADLDAIEADLEAADLPEGDEDEEGPREELEGRLAELRDDLEEARGPYAEDVAGIVEDARSDVEAAQWPEGGVDDLGEAVRAFVESVNDALGTDVAVEVDDPAFEAEPYVDGGDLEALTGTLAAAATAVTDAGLDPDEDAETIAALLEAAEALGDGVEAARAWDDLEVREKLDAHGYYDVLDHRKDFPPEWGALKVWEKRGRADMVLLAFDLMGSEFMEEHCLEALGRLGPEEATEPMLELAERRNRDAIRVLGKIGAEEAVETLLEYTGEESDPKLQTVTLKALGEIGSREATGAVADQLAAENDEVRSAAARALGLIGDTRAIEPLADVLEDDDADRVRASAAWALNRIGTERAREVVAEYADDRAYVVQAEAEKAAETG